MATTYSAIERNKKPAGALEIPEDFQFYYLRYNYFDLPLYPLQNLDNHVNNYTELKHY